MRDLKKYNSKRNFNSTDEPEGKKISARDVSRMDAQRFVIQFHQARAKHFDFRLEYGGVLLSWTVPKGLSTNPKDRRLAIMVEDHPISYFNFEGTIAKGNYGAGTVEIYDKGKYYPLFPMDAGLKKGHLKFVLNGKRFKGTWSLFKTGDNNWLMSKLDDEFSGKENSVKNPFSFCGPQLATLVKNIPHGKNWAFEIKYDGYRALSFVEEKTAKILSRNKTDITKRFIKIAKCLECLTSDAFVLDGEIVCFDENGRSNFSLLQSNIKKGKLENACYVVFDLLSEGGRDLRGESLKKRRDKLKKLLQGNKHSNIIFSESILGNGKKCFEFAKSHNLEGIVAKDQTSPYTSKRNESWLKIKCEKTEEFLCLGYLKSDTNIFKSLLVGKRDGKKILFMGHVGTGFSVAKKRKMMSIFSKIMLKNPSKLENFSESGADVVWLKPVLSVKIKYTEITNSGLLRHPSFIEIANESEVLG